MSARQASDNDNHELPGGGKRGVFISYSSSDDEPPPGPRKGEGFVSHLYAQLAWELQNLGLPKEELWLASKHLTSSDQYIEVLAEEIAKSDILLAILSNGYVNSPWCREEVSVFARRLEAMPDHKGQRRIFRVDKQEVAENELPTALRHVNSVRFYEKDPERGYTREFYRRGQIVRKKPYEDAILQLAHQIHTRLRELRQGRIRPADPRKAEETREFARLALARPQAGMARSAEGRAVFLAKPAFDLMESYSRLAHELSVRGFKVVPDPEKDLPRLGAEALEIVRKALAEAELSIHLLGEGRGFQPDGLELGIAPLQLAEAAAEAGRRPGFHRLIWAPKIIPGAEESGAERDPLEILTRYGPALASDEVDGDTATRFNDFVVQRLAARKPAAPTAALSSRAPLVYVTAAPADQALALAVAKQLTESGIKALLVPSDTGFALAGRADHLAFCWGAANEEAVAEALDRLDTPQWRAARPGGKIWLLAGPPESESKKLACELDSFGTADAVVTAPRPGWHEALVRRLLVPAS